MESNKLVPQYINEKAGMKKVDAENIAKIVA